MKKHKSIIFWTIVFAAYCIALWLTDKYIFQYFEQQQTFFADAGFLRSTLGQVGGCTILLSDLIIQFFVCPAAGIIMTSLLLTLISLVSYRVFRHISDKWDTALLGILPGAGCILQMYNMNFQYFGIVSMLIMVLFLWGYVNINKDLSRLIWGILMVLALFAFSGAIASLFAISVLLIEVFTGTRGAWKFLLVPVVTAAAGAFAICAGAAADIKHLLGPFAYFTLRVDISDVAYLSWGCWGIALLLACIRSVIKTSGRFFTSCFLAVQLAGIFCLCFFGGKTFVNTSDIFFRELNQLARTGEWEHIIQRYGDRPSDNLLFQNYLAVALAEKGLLADRAFDYNFQSIRSVFVETNKTPYVSNLLGDVFYSMGELGLAQRYYFESNESRGDYSPACLQKLALTNLAYGAYGVADKYLSLLGKTLFYKGWAEKYKGLLYDDAAVESDSVTGSLRRCIFPDNKLSGLGGLDIDFRRILRANPEHSQTMQYLGTVLLLMKDIEAFMGLLEEFYGTSALGGELPRSFQQAVCVFANGDTEILEKYKVSAETIAEFAAFKEKRSAHNFWFFYYYQ